MIDEITDGVRRPKPSGEAAGFGEASPLQFPRAEFTKTKQGSAKLEV